MARRRLDLDVTVQEMLRLREEGMSNKQIAGQLDVHYNTILKYIGKEPRSPRTSVVKNERGQERAWCCWQGHGQGIQRQVQSGGKTLHKDL